MTSAVRHTLLQDFIVTRQASVAACETLVTEDYSLQAAIFASPPKWHLAHTSWFYETFILKPFYPGYSVFHPAYEVLFNSYYNGVGEQYPRGQRGLLSRPTVAEVLRYRQHVDQYMQNLLTQFQHPEYQRVVQRCTLGIQHEKQHQELFFTDIKFSFSHNPLLPAYCSAPQPESPPWVDVSWHDFAGGLVEIGLPDTSDDVNAAYQGFCFDNETPVHCYHLAPFSVANRLVTNIEYQQFIDEGGYQRPELWLADGWALVQEQYWQRPLYWHDNNQHFTLYGLIERQPNQPVCHLSGYEADAYARWAGARLPTEFEWEHMAQLSSDLTLDGFYRDTQLGFHPLAAELMSGVQQLHSHLWQWTSSAYSAYPGMKIQSGAIGEYNGKFMSNQWVLRGGSCVSPGRHLRPTYRNFFYPQDRWQFSGLRLARNF